MFIRLGQSVWEQTMCFDYHMCYQYECKYYRYQLQEAYEKVLHSGQPQEATKDLEIHFENYLRLLINNQVNCKFSNYLFF